MRTAGREVWFASAITQGIARFSSPMPFGCGAAQILEAEPLNLSTGSTRTTSPMNRSSGGPPERRGEPPWDSQEPTGPARRITSRYESRNFAVLGAV